MDYKETIEYLYKSAPLFQQVGGSAYKEGLSTTKTLDSHFNHPHTHYRTIHVAGTNGKGSCAHTIAAILQHKGLKVGLYTSPHLVDFRERIKINGVKIPQQYVIDFVKDERAFFEQLSPSFFEITTAMALKYFADEKIDVAVIEVGLGGRLDCTNIIMPCLSVITNISFDHTQFLGNTLAKIAYEKAGIIKPDIPVVIGEALPETRPVFQKKADAVNSPIIFAEDYCEVTSYKTTPQGRLYFTRTYDTLEGELIGECQVKNTNTILAAIKEIKELFGITKEDVAFGFKNVCSTTGLQGRWQVLQSNPTVVCDTGHNTGGWKYISHQLHDIADKVETLHIVFGMAGDKDIDSVIAHLPERAKFYWTKASVRRAMEEHGIEKIALSHHLSGKTFDSVDKAYTAALQNAQPADFIYVGGSSFIVADLLTFLQKRQNATSTL